MRRVTRATAGRHRRRLRAVAAGPVAALVALQTATPETGVGPDELADYWPAFVRGAWFVAGFLVVAVVGWYLVEPALSRIVRRRNRNNPTMQEALARYVRVVVLLVAVFVGAATAGYGRFLSDSALVVAAATLAVGVAGQAVIGSLVSGLALVVDPEFSVGDYIEWADGTGTIQSITLRVTRVLTPDGELVTIPNTVLASNAIVRPYGRTRYRVVEHVGFAYDADVDEAMRHLTAAARDVDGVLEMPAPEAFVDDLGDDGIVVRVHYWIRDPTRRDVFVARSAYARGVVSRLEAAGIAISPPSLQEFEGRVEVADVT